MKSFLSAVANYGVKKDYLPWEVALVRKLNQITFLGYTKVQLTLIIFLILGRTEYAITCLFLLIFGPLVFVFNKVRDYVWASYAYYILAIVFMDILCIQLGPNSFFILHFFPVSITIMQMYGRKELLKHMIVILLICASSIVGILLFYQLGTIPTQATPDDQFIKNINIFLSLFATIILMIIMSFESVRQEKLITNIMKEKEILLAEVFHRVKNNMNIITSILNLKKHMSTSLEVKDAMEECRNRVFSMALVHTRLYQSENISAINLKEYVSELLDELIFSMGGNDESKLEFEGENITIDINKAIPCGLIINEIVTNAFKYASVSDKQLKIKVKLKAKEGQLFLSIQDNGPGIHIQNKKETLGMLLIESLSEQLNAAHSFENNDGLLFRICFGLNEK